MLLNADLALEKARILSGDGESFFTAEEHIAHRGQTMEENDGRKR